MIFVNTAKQSVIREVQLSSTLLQALFSVMMSVLWIALIFYSATAISQTQDKYVVSFTDHKSVIKRYVPVLEQAYKDVGINAEFIMVNDRRAIKLLNKGRTDADAVKTLEILPENSNLVPLPTPISKIEVLLICQPNLECNLSLLNDASKMLGIVAATEFYSELLMDTQVQITELSSFHSMREMFKHGRLDMMISVFDPAVEDPRITYTNYLKIKEKFGYHLIHRKHKRLLPRLNKAVQKRLSQQTLKD